MSGLGGERLQMLLREADSLPARRFGARRRMPLLRGQERRWLRSSSSGGGSTPGAGREKFALLRDKQWPDDGKVTTALLLRRPRQNRGRPERLERCSGTRAASRVHASAIRPACVE